MVSCWRRLIRRLNFSIDWTYICNTILLVLITNIAIIINWYKIVWISRILNLLAILSLRTSFLIVIIINIWIIKKKRVISWYGIISNCWLKLGVCWIKIYFFIVLIILWYLLSYKRFVKGFLKIFIPYLFLYLIFIRAIVFYVLNTSNFSGWFILWISIIFFQLFIYFIISFWRWFS